VFICGHFTIFVAALQFSEGFGGVFGQGRAGFFILFIVGA